MSRDCYVALLRGAMGLSAVCDWGISWSHSLTIFAVLQDEAELKRRKDNAMKVNEFISGMIDEHRESYDENNIRDFVDFYIQVSQQDEDDTRDAFISN